MIGWEHRNLVDGKPWTVADNLANIGRLLLAICWTLAAGTGRWIFQRPRGWGWLRWRQMAFSWGRRESPKAMRCACGWVGPLRWAVHDYQSDGFGDVEGVDLCPRCQNDDLAPVLVRKDGAWGCKPR